MPMREFWSFQAQDTHTDLYILDEIASVESWWIDTVTPQSFRRQLSGVSGELHIWLNSPGGDAFAGAAIYDMIREYSSSGRGKTVAMISMAASAASIIAMACDEIRISVLGTIMIHEPWSNPAGKASVLRANADVLETIRDAQIDAYVKRTGQTRDKVLELMNAGDGIGTYMNANMATKLGFADSIIEGEDGGEAASFASSMRSMQIRSALRNAANLVAEAAAKQPEPDATPTSDDTSQIEELRRATIEARKVLMRTCAKTF